MTLAEAIKLALEKYRALYRNVSVTHKTIATWVEMLDGLDPEAVLQAFERALSENTRAELPSVPTIKKHVKEILAHRERMKKSLVRFTPPVTRDDEQRLLRTKRMYEAELRMLMNIPHELEQRFGPRQDGGPWPHTEDELFRIRVCQDALNALKEVGIE